MKIESLKVGQVIKNYKELCNLLEIKVEAGNSKKAQLKELERFIKYHKEGNKFVVDEIYEVPLEKVDGRCLNGSKIEYIKNIEVLILNLLAENETGKIFLSKYPLLNKLKMINANYSCGKYRMDKLGKLMNIETSNINEFYSSTDSMLIRNLETALNNLDNKCLINWSKEKTICEPITDNACLDKKVEYDEYGEENVEYITKAYMNHREATDDEKILITFIEKEVLKSLDCNSKQEVISSNQWSEFRCSVESKLIQHGIAYYYDSYKILYNEEHISEEITELYDLLLSKTDKYINEDILNKSLQDRIRENALKRRNRALEQQEEWFGELESEVILVRCDSNYLDNNSKLVDVLINSEYKDIKSKIKRQKMDEKS